MHPNALKCAYLGYRLWFSHSLGYLRGIPLGRDYGSPYFKKNPINSGTGSYGIIKNYVIYMA
jgi:hypothetical protein